jgi:hypothetical protein
MLADKLLSSRTVAERRLTAGEGSVCMLADKLLSSRTVAERRLTAGEGSVCMLAGQALERAGSPPTGG